MKNENGPVVFLCHILHESRVTSHDSCSSIYAMLYALCSMREVDKITACSQQEWAFYLISQMVSQIVIPVFDIAIFDIKLWGRES